MTDEELVLAARTGKREAFDQLTERYWHRCWRIARIYACSPQEAEDQAQNTLVEAWLHLDECDAAKFRGWLDKIAQNECMQFHRRRARRPEGFLHLGNVWRRVQSLDENPEQRLMRLRVCAMVRQEVSRLPPAWRGVVRWRRFEEWPIADVATRLGLNVPAAKSRLLRAQAELHTRLKQRLSGVVVRRAEQRALDAGEPFL